MKLIEQEINPQTLNTQKKNLYSFDIFDTLITRTTATPYGIFALIQEELKTNQNFKNYPINLKNNYYHIRINTEKYVRAVNFSEQKTREITIDDIYKHIGFNYSLSNEQTQNLLNLELHIESENFIPIEENINKIKSLYNQNQKVILISDMYIQSHIIRAFLRPFLNFIDDIEIFVSCEAKYSKGNGKLFEYVYEKLGISPANWYHTGDNTRSDYVMAKNFGINAEKYNYPKLETYEKTLLKNNENNLDYQKIIGQCKNIRLTAPTDLKTRAGISLGGPILTAYVQWILYNSIQKGITRLYFIARDGYILKEIADILIAKYNLPISTKYIYGSRAAWIAPSADKYDKNYYELLDAIFFNIDVISSESMDMTDSELRKFFDKKIINKPLSFKFKNNLKDKLLYNLEFKNLLIEKNKEKKDLVLKYLKTEINFSDNNFAFVDLAGSGRTNNRLTKIINMFFNKKIKNFYMQSNNDAQSTLTNERFIYLYSDSGFKFLELLSRAPHGQTLGYKEDEYGKIIPILDKINTKLLADWDYDSYLNGIKLFAQNSNIQISQDFITRYLDLIRQKDNTIIETFSNELFSCVGKNENMEFAPVITKPQAFMYLLFNKELKTNAIHWSLYRSKNTVRKIIHLKNQYGSLRKYLIHIHFWRKKKQFFIRIFGIEISLRRLIWRIK